MDSSLSYAPVFEGLPGEVLAPVLDQLVQRSFPQGATVIAEGDFLGEMYIVQSGVAEVLMYDADGVEHVINRVGSGGTLGEIALITGQPHSATVRACEPLDVLVLNDRELREAANVLPELYRNLVAILSRRLVRSNRLAVGTALARVSLLLDDDAPPILGYALACSVAWHAQCSTLLLRIDDRPPPQLLVDLAEATVAPSLTGPDRTVNSRGAAPRAYVHLVSPTGLFAPDKLANTLDHISHHYLHILVQVPSRATPGLNVRRRVRLTGTTQASSASATSADTPTVRAWSPIGDGRLDFKGVLHVPQPDAVDEQGLRNGLVRAGGRMGQALGWAARHVAGLKVGLALGAGSLRGYAHVGVIKALDRIKLPIDYIGGTSIGAAVAALFALGYSPPEILEKLDWAATAAFRLSLPTRGMLSSGALQSRLKSIGGDTRIEDLPMPLVLTATDLNTRRQVVFRTGLLWPAVMASLTIPGVYPAQTMSGRTLVDGGVSNPVPSSALSELGADTVIAVKLLGGLTQDPDYMEAVEPTGGQPGVVEVLMRSLEIVQSHIPNTAPDVATVVIAPEFGSMRGLGLRNFAEGSRFVDVGEAAAEASLQRLATALPWLRD